MACLEGDECTCSVAYCFKIRQWAAQYEVAVERQSIPVCAVGDKLTFTSIGPNGVLELWEDLNVAAQQIVAARFFHEPNADKVRTSAKYVCP